MTNPPDPSVTERVALSECPVGLFWFDDTLALKTEYGSNEGRIDAYIVESGEMFWGPAPQTIASQRGCPVQPIDTDAARAAISSMPSLEEENADEVERVVYQIVQEVCELPDYQSPEVQPDLLQCTVEELSAICSAAIASLTRKDGSEGVERLLKALEPFEQDWRDMGMPGSEHVPDDKLMLDCDPQGEILTVGHYRELFAALTSTREGLTGGEVCRCSEEARTNRVAARMGASFEEAGDD